MTMVQPPPTQACRRSSSTASSPSSPSTRRRLRSSTRRAAATTSARPPPPLATVRTAYRKPCPRLTPYDVCRRRPGDVVGVFAGAGERGCPPDAPTSSHLLHSRVHVHRSPLPWYFVISFCSVRSAPNNDDAWRHEATLELSPADRPTGMRVCVCVVCSRGGA